MRTGSSGPVTVWIWKRLLVHAFVLTRSLSALEVRIAVETSQADSFQPIGSPVD